MLKRVPRHRTLVKLGLQPSLIDVHLVLKGSNIHDDEERSLMLEKDPAYVIVVDQGSRPGPPIIDKPDAKCLLIDHHLSDEFPDMAIVRGLLLHRKLLIIDYIRSCPAVTVLQYLQVLL